MRLFLLLLIFVPVVALAGPAEDAAVEASRVLDENCSDLGGREVTLKAGNLKEVATAWESVSRVYDLSPQVYLLYWRGALAQCLGGFDDDARDDLESFWLLTAEEPALADQRRDAQRRLARLGVRVSDERAQRPGPALGVAVGFAAAGGALGGMAGWQLGILREAEAAYVDGRLPREDVDRIRREGEAAAATTGLSLAAVGSVAAAVPFILLEVLGPPKPTSSPASSIEVTPVPLLTPDGIVPGIGGRW